MIPLALIVASALVHFIYFGYPPAVVFDEVHNGNFLTNYWHGTYFFDVHPPLGKLIETAFGYLTHATGAVADYTNIGNPLPMSVILLRIIPMVAGTLLPVIVYLVLRRLDMSRLTAGLAATLIILENSLLVQSRFILFDIIMILFGFVGIYFYLRFRDAREEKRWLRISFLVLSLLFTAMPPCIKWTGLAFPLIIMLMEAYRLFVEEKSRISAKIKTFVGLGALYGAVIFAMYVSLFGIHFALLPHSGPGDAFMSPQFQKGLAGNIFSQNQNLQPEGFAEKFVELNIAMLDADHRLNVYHSYSSRWYTWPFELRPIFYWQGTSTTDTSGATSQSYIYLLGNPVIYWLGIMSVIGLLIYIVSVIIRKKSASFTPTHKKLLYVALIGFAANYLPFTAIGRVMFLYHYEAALVFAIIAIAVAVECMPARAKKITAISIVGVALVSFIFFAPLTYGTPLTQGELQARMWISSWR